MPNWLATTWEKQNFVQKVVYKYFSINSPILFLSYPRFAQPKDSPLRFLALTDIDALLIGFK
jgi:hypothetical protein